MPEAVPRALVLANPIAGLGRAERLAQQAEQLLQEAGFEVLRRATDKEEGALPAAREHADQISLLVVAGGDGSIREAVAGLGPRARAVDIAVLPCGNANVVAREMGIPLDGREALALITGGQPRQVDIARANGELFLAMLGVGWDARTVHWLARIRATRFGSAWYRFWADGLWFVAGFLALYDPGPGRFELHCEGAAQPAKGFGAVIANLRCYGKGWSMVPEADASSGSLHFQARRRAGPLFIVWQLIAAIGRRPLPAWVSAGGSASRIELRASSPFLLQIDGDAREPASHITLEVDPGAARFRVPAAS